MRLRYPLGLLLLCAGLTALVWPGGSYFGSEVDWFSQHLALAETIRTECLTQGTLAPSFLPLGGGSNGYQFAYYGYFRPDILLGCLLPNVPMSILLPAYVLAGYGAGTLLFYALARAHGFSRAWAGFGGALYACAACFFHLHRQVMFVNYLPFLLLCLLSIRKGRDNWLPLWICLLCMHSFFYAPASLLAIGWYWHLQRGRPPRPMGVRAVCHSSLVRGYLPRAALGVGMAAMLLLPAGLAILEHRRASGDPGDVLLPNLSMKGLLYSAYGVGLTAICLYALLAGLQSRRFRKESIVYLVLSVWNLASYLLNGTLYARPKILTVFLPLLLLHTLRVLRALFRREYAPPLWPCALLPGVLLPYLGADKLPLVAADVAVVLAFVLARRLSARLPKASWPALLLCPCVLFVHTGQSDSFAQKRAAPTFSAEECAEIYTEPGYRFDSLTAPLDACNRLDFSGQQKSTMYSSVTNPAYNALYYDILQTPIGLNNRTIMAAEGNPFALRLLGVRYLAAAVDELPAGYTVLRQKDGQVLAENPAVLPIAYATADLMGQAQFDALDDTERIAAITTHTVVPQAQTVAFDSPIQDFTPQFDTVSLPDGLSVEQQGEGYRLRAARTVTLELTLQNPPDGQILLFSCGVQNHTSSGVEIEINGVLNRLSNRSAPYPNGNNRFHYQLSGDLRKLTVTLSSGEYTLSDFSFQTCPLSVLAEQEVYPLQPAGPAADGVLLDQMASLPVDGYFVTSIPRQRGMELCIDGVSVPIETVNGAFVGAPLQAGEHTIRLTFQPPGEAEGQWLGLACWCAWAAVCAKGACGKKRTRGMSRHAKEM